jgi:hypothetical protein
MRRRHAQPTPEGVTKSVAALVEKLFDRWRTTDDWIHAALTLPDVVETPQDRAYAAQALSTRLLPNARLNTRTRKVDIPMSIVTVIAGLSVGFGICAIFMFADSGVNIGGYLALLWWLLFYCPIGWLVGKTIDYFNLRRENGAEVRKACARSLASLGDVDEAPNLARIALQDEKPVRIECRKSLMKILGDADLGEDRRFDTITSENLGQILRSMITAEHAAVLLRALAWAGSPGALPSLEAYTHSPHSREAAELARQTIDAIKRRAEEDRQRDTLLRAAEPKEDALLRPAVAQGHDPDQLLRVEQTRAD